MTVREHLDNLDGSDRAALRLITGYSDTDIDDLGGLSPMLRHCGTCIESDEPCPTCPVCGLYVSPPKFD